MLEISKLGKMSGPQGKSVMHISPDCVFFFCFVAKSAAAVVVKLELFRQTASQQYDDIVSDCSP